MSWNEWITIAVIVSMTLALVLRAVSPTVAVVGATLALYLAGVSDAEVVFGGFSNPAPLAIAALYVVAGAVERTGALQRPLRSVLVGDSVSGVTARVALAAAALSTVVANTPVVAMLIGPVRRWADQHKTAPSLLLLPLSYASIIGGTLTMIGTSTNLVASGAAVASGGEPFGFFDPARVGLPFAALSLVLLCVLGPRLMPRRGERPDGAVAAPFTVSMVVEPGGALDGVSIAKGSLRDLPSAHLVGLRRNGDLWSPVAPQSVLKGGDVVTFAGQVNRIAELERLDGLRLDEDKHLWALDDGQHAWFEVVVGATSPLQGKTLREAQFRQRYQAAVVALHRDGEAVDAKLGSVRLRRGDALLLVADLGFRERWKYRGDFLLISRRSEAPPTAQTKAPLAGAILLVTALLPLLGFTSVLKASIIGAVATVATGILTPRQARQSVNIDVVVMIAASIGLGQSVRAVGLADRVAVAVSDAAHSLSQGPGSSWLAASLLVAATLVATEVITNAGAAAIMVPVAMETAARSGEDPKLFALGITLAASASFLSPIGYQTNMMVYGPGHYKPGDYLRLGVPLVLVVMVLAPLSMTIDYTLW